MSLQRDKVIYHLFRFSSEKQGYFIKIRLCGDKSNRNVHIIALSAFEGGKHYHLTFITQFITIKDMIKVYRHNYPKYVIMF